MIAARPIRFTHVMEAHRTYVEALGGRRVTSAPGWEVWALGSGRLALHAASDEQPAGQDTLAWEVPDLDAWVNEARQRGLACQVGQTPHGLAATVTAPDGTSFTVDPSSGPTTEPVTRDSLAVLPIWYTTQAHVDGARQVLRGLGAVQRITADSDVWTDFRCPGGGLVAVHATDEETGVELGFEYAGDVEELITPLHQVGVEALLIDETYSRTLQIPDPDRPGSMVWINEKMQDLYGYRVEQTGSSTLGG